MTNWKIDATDETFEKEVIERSKNTLCVVDFWAEWCGPCRMLGPILEELAQEFEGKFTLVKIDTEQAPQVSASFGIQSIPAVFAFSNGEPVDGFLGVRPKEQIKEWIESQLSSGEIQAAIDLVQSDPESAISQLENFQKENEDEPAIQIALADAYLHAGKEEQAAKVIASLEDRGFLEPAAEKIKAKLDIKSKERLDLEATQKKADENPDDLGLKLEFASALFGHDHFEQGFEVCLDVIKQDKTGAGDKARELMVEVFRSLPDDSELTHEYRRKLSMALY